MKLLLLLAFLGVCTFAQRGNGGPHRRLKIDSEEFDTEDDDYDYNFEEVKRWKPSSTKDISPFTSKMYSTFNKITGQHFYHANKRISQKKQNKGFISQAEVGNIISNQVYERQQKQLNNACSDLVELYYLTKDGAQFLTVSKKEKKQKIELGWRNMSSVGYCVESKKSGKCGASKPLMESKKSKNGRTIDYYYTTDKNDYSKQLRGEYVDTKRDVICYLW